MFVRIKTKKVLALKLNKIDVGNFILFTVHIESIDDQFPYNAVLTIRTG